MGINGAASKSQSSQIRAILTVQGPRRLELQAGYLCDETETNERNDKYVTGEQSDLVVEKLSLAIASCKINKSVYSLYNRMWHILSFQTIRTIAVLVLYKRTSAGAVKYTKMSLEQQMIKKN